MLFSYQNPPYVMQDSETKILSGLIPDVLDEISKIIDVDMDIHLNPDSQYGYKMKNGTWTGMIGELVNNVS